MFLLTIVYLFGALAILMFIFEQFIAGESLGDSSMVPGIILAGLVTVGVISLIQQLIGAL